MTVDCTISAQVVVSTGHVRPAHGPNMIDGPRNDTYHVKEGEC